jgi:UDP-N-acetylmuramate--alanine ligase
MQFDLLLPDEDKRWPVTIQQPGRHNVLNALGAAAVAWELGVSADDIIAGLGGFEGVGRRFESIGELSINDHSVLAFEDYGHHPTELDAIVQTARAGWPDRRLVLVFQPHRYSRTRDQFDAFARVLSEPDVLVLADIYAAGEAPMAGIDANALAAAIQQREELDIHRVGQVDEVLPCLERISQDGDLLLIMGAGNVGRLGRQLRAAYSGVSR